MDRAGLIREIEASGSATQRGGYWFLHDPNWAEAELRQARLCHAHAAEMEYPAEGWLCIPTGGSTGALRFARHDERTLTAAVRGFCAHFGVSRVNAVGVLPAHHVSGLMARIRSVDTEGAYVDVSWRALEAGEHPDLAEGDWFISLVPTQLGRLLERPAATDWLRRFKAVLIGGAPLWRALEQRARDVGLPLGPCYGSTETAAMVTALRPEERPAGEGTSCGRPLSHAAVSIVSPETFAPLSPGETGLVVVRGESVHRGYFGNAPSAGAFVSADLGYFDPDGCLHIAGRRDTVIISGGEKVLPAEVESALHSTGQFAAVAVLGAPDSQWGQCVVACYEPTRRAIDFEVVKQQLNATLAAYKHPKRYVEVRPWPVNDQGKVRRGELVRRLGELSRADNRWD